MPSRAVSFDNDVPGLPHGDSPCSDKASKTNSPTKRRGGGWVGDMRRTSRRTSLVQGAIQLLFAERSIDRVLNFTSAKSKVEEKVKSLGRAVTQKEMEDRMKKLSVLVHERGSIDPDSRRWLAWLVVMTFFGVMSPAKIVFQIAFAEQYRDWWNPAVVVDWFIDLIFVANVMAHTKLASQEYGEGDDLVLRQVKRRYLRTSQCAIDAMACVPLEMFAVQPSAFAPRARTGGVAQLPLLLPSLSMYSCHRAMLNSPTHRFQGEHYHPGWRINKLLRLWSLFIHIAELEGRAHKKKTLYVFLVSRLYLKWCLLTHFAACGRLLMCQIDDTDEDWWARDPSHPWRPSEEDRGGPVLTQYLQVRPPSTYLAGDEAAQGCCTHVPDTKSPQFSARSLSTGAWG